MRFSHLSAPRKRKEREQNSGADSRDVTVFHSTVLYSVHKFCLLTHHSLRAILLACFDVAVIAQTETTACAVKVRSTQFTRLVFTHTTWNTTHGAHSSKHTTQLIEHLIGRAARTTWAGAQSQSQRPRTAWAAQGSGRVTDSRERHYCRACARCARLAARSARACP